MPDHFTQLLEWRRNELAVRGLRETSAGFLHLDDGLPRRREAVLRDGAAGEPLRSKGGHLPTDLPARHPGRPGRRGRPSSEGPERGVPGEHRRDPRPPERPSRGAGDVRPGALRPARTPTFGGRLHRTHSGPDPYSPPAPVRGTTRVRSERRRPGDRFASRGPRSSVARLRPGAQGFATDRGGLRDDRPEGRRRSLPAPQTARLLVDAKVAEPLETSATRPVT